jgi:hypothetical protein
MPWDFTRCLLIRGWWRLSVSWERVGGIAIRLGPREKPPNIGVFGGFGFVRLAWGALPSVVRLCVARCFVLCGVDSIWSYVEA